MSCSHFGHDDLLHVGVVKTTLCPEGDLLLHLGDSAEPQMVLMYRVQHIGEETGHTHQHKQK